MLADRAALYDVTRDDSAKGMRPDPSDPSVPPVAAVCIYPDMVATAVAALRGSSVRIASVATAFPSGRAAMQTKLQDVRDAIAAGATEVDMVIDRGAFHAGHYLQVFSRRSSPPSRPSARPTGR